ncbi:MAG: hypothetical protein ACXAC2_03605 [Candidatus Kariarchaeaceae archaeon]|jgi:hypothetical protein
MQEIYLQILHRIAFVLAVVPAIVVPILPNIFNDHKDKPFVEKAYSILILSIKFFLLFLVISGLFRVTLPLTIPLVIKLFLAITTVLSFFIINIELSDERFQEISFVRVVLMFITGFVGLVI